MVDESTSDDFTTTNKGVNVHSESLPARVHRSSESNTTSSTNPCCKSVAGLKNDLQTVLDLMGTSTPYHTSSEADNEDSYADLKECSKSRETSSSSRGYKRFTPQISPKSGFSKSTNVQESRSIEFEIHVDKQSLLADFGTHSDTNFDTFEDYEHSCCDHNRPIIKPECICMNRPSVPARTVCYSTPKTVEYKKRNIFDWVKEKSSELKLKKPRSAPCDLYKINICGQMDELSAPKRVVFDLVEGIPKPTSSTVATNTIRNPVEKCKTNPEFSALSPNRKNEPITNKIQRNIFYDSDGNTRVDFYYFDHGNAQYFHTTDTPPILKSEIIAEKTERYTTKFWAEVFASVHIGVSFCVSFILQLFKFLLYSIIRPLAVGFIQMGSDYFFKPFLTTFFNGLVQPFLIFLYNTATSLRDLCDPIAEAFGYFCREVAVLLRAIRLCTYRKNDDTSCGCDKRKKCEC